MSFRKIFVPPGQGEHSLNDISDIEFVWVVGVGWLGWYWHERAAVQAVAVRQSTGNDVSGHYFHHFFLLLIFFSQSCPFLIEGMPESRNLFNESCS